MQDYQKISEALKKSEGEKAKIRGWIYRTRSSGKLAFVTLRDESGIIQVIVEKGKLP
ncbi:MAG: OB-fold nucleic acid binding domain-containing protein, partial [Candidatus Methanofastidiosia archaeon]